MVTRSRPPCRPCVNRQITKCQKRPVSACRAALRRHRNAARQCRAGLCAEVHPCRGNEGCRRKNSAATPAGAVFAPAGLNLSKRDSPGAHARLLVFRGSTHAQPAALGRGRTLPESMPAETSSSPIRSNSGRGGGPRFCAAACLTARRKVLAEPFHTWQSRLANCRAADGHRQAWAAKVGTAGVFPAFRRGCNPLANDQRVNVS